MVRTPIACVVGTRPDAVKMAPVIAELQNHPALCPVLITTGQQRELSARALGDFGLVPDIDLDLMRNGQSPVAILAAALPTLAAILDDLAPAMVLAHGDTMTALAAAQAAALGGIALGHVEAGLRTGDRGAPFPEELNRRVIAQLADLHFAPTDAARSALLGEGIDPNTVHVTGNTGVDALLLMEARLTADRDMRIAQARRLPTLDPLRPLILVTAHRRENHGAPMAAIAEAVARLAADGAEIVLPVHPHPAVSEVIRARLIHVPYVHLVPPVGYATLVWLLARASVVLTDSGGLQEEAPAMGVPVLVMRDVTERHEGVSSGNAMLVGTATVAIVTAVRRLLRGGADYTRMAERALPYGDGRAAPAIIDILARRLAPSVRADAELVH